MSKRRHTTSDQENPNKEAKMVLEPVKLISLEGKYCPPSTLHLSAFLERVEAHIGVHGEACTQPVKA